MDSKIGFEMNLIVVEAIRGRCASFTVLTATVSEIFGGQTTSPILEVYISVVHCWMSSAAFWSLLCSCRLHISYKLTSSTYFTSSTSAYRSYIMLRKLSVPDRVQWGTPPLTPVQTDVVSANLTICVLHVKNIFCHSTYIWASPFSRRILWLI